MPLTQHQVQVRLQAIPMTEREPVRTTTSVSPKSGGPPAEMLAKLSKAHAAVSAAFEKIDPVSRDGVPQYVAAKNKYREVAQEVDAWLAESGPAEGDACAARADDLEDELLALCAEADRLRDEIAQERARAALLRNLDVRKRGGIAKPERHRPGGARTSAAALGVEPRTDTPLVSQAEAQKLRRGQDAVDLQGDPVPFGSDYRVIHRNVGAALGVLSEG